MKLTKIYLIIALLSVSLTGSAQYIHLLDTGRVWNCWWNSAGGGGSGGYQLKLGQTVIFGSKTFYNVLYSNNLYPGEWLGNGIYLREDSARKVWQMWPGYPDHLLYDFSLTPGDTFNMTLQCDSVDSVFIGNSYRRRWTFTSGEKWVEGLGSLTSGLMFPDNYGTVGILSEAVCVHENGNLVYQDTSFTDCSPVGSQYDKWVPDLLTHWYHDYLEENPNGTEPNKGYVNIKSIKDTVISSHSCKKLLSTFVNHLGATVGTIPFYTYTNGRKVYYTFNHNFSMLYDFGANPGDSWTMRNPYEIYGLSPDSDSMSVITVDSVAGRWDHFPIVYKQMYTHSSGSWFFDKPVMVRTGGDGFLFPGKWNEWTYPYPAGLRCYEDNNIWMIFYTSQCNGLYTGISDTEQENDNFLVINPVCGDFHVLFNNKSPLSGIVSLYDNQGKQLNTVHINGLEEIIIPGKHLPRGLYFIRIMLNDGKTVVKKALKID